MTRATLATTLLLFTSLLVPNFLAAQATSGVTGIVTDPSGAVIVGADVKLTNPLTAYAASTTTNDAGAYVFVRVPPGQGYVITISKSQFRTVTMSDVALGVSITETKNARLEVGDTQERIEVKAEGEGTVNTIDASIGNVITDKQVQDLPSLFRDDASTLLRLEPGVQAPDKGSDAQLGSITGSRADSSNITLDGLDVNDETIGQAFTTVGRAPIDSIAEGRTIVGGSDSTFGRSGGGQIDLVTKGGTNQWHGQVSEYNRISALAANDFFNNLNGVPRGQLTRNQFGGSIGGPILKDKLFFFFTYLGKRESRGLPQNIVVPLNGFRNGQLSYIDTNGNIQSVSQADLAALDPLGIGASPELLSFIDSRYPVSNNLTVGDGINTGGYAFTAPFRRNENTYVGRIDYNLNSKHQLFARGTWDRDNSTQVQQLFPQDPDTLIKRIVHDRTWVVGDTWAINSYMTNQAFFGLSRQVDDFPAAFDPTAPNLWGFTNGLTGPFGDFRAQSRNVPVPEIRDNFTWVKGTHTMQFGGDIKPIRVHSTSVNDINFPTIGLQSQITSLDPSLRPANISDDPGAQQLWDDNFTTILGRFASNTGQYNYDQGGNPFPQNTAANRDFHYNEYEFFAQDSWRVHPNLTITYGLRWNYHSVPFEENGFQSVPTVFESELFDTRQRAASAGINTPTSAPFVSYTLGGPANHGPDYYHPNWRDFAPRLGIAYSPSFTEGTLGKVFGDRKTSIRAGAGLNYDRVLSTLSFEIDEVSQLFAQQLGQQFGVPLDPRQSLQTDPRFTSINAPVPPPAPGTVPRPSVTPFVFTSDGTNCPIPVAAGQPCATGLFANNDLFQLNDHFHSPYSISVSFGVQRELPKNFMVEADYFGRFGRRLVGVGDPAQQLNFKDPASGQGLNAAFGNVQKALQQGASVVPTQPWFENQMNAALPNVFGAGATCENVFGLDCTNFLANTNLRNSFLIGDLSTLDVILANAGFLLPNTGLDYQTGSVANVGNFGSSSYNGLILTLRKRFSSNVQFDVDYTWAHSIDNVSDITNDVIFSSFNGQGLVCDLRNLRVCRANSSFDATQTLSANYLVQLPIGRGQQVLSGIPGWLNAIVGGWSTSGIVAFHSGYPWSATTTAFPIAFTQQAPAVLTGPRSAVKQDIHVDPTTHQLQFFADADAAVNAFSFPFGGDTGQRNALRGPRYVDVDMAFQKTFQMPWAESHNLQFRAEAFNIFNHPIFNDPSTDPNQTGSLNTTNNLITGGAFGVLTNTAHNPREWQLSLKYSF